VSAGIGVGVGTGVEIGVGDGVGTKEGVGIGEDTTGEDEIYGENVGAGVSGMGEGSRLAASVSAAPLHPANKKSTHIADRSNDLVAFGIYTFLSKDFCHCYNIVASYFRQYINLDLVAEQTHAALRGVEGSR